MDKKPLETIKDVRQDAVWRLFDSKFDTNFRIMVGSATCENAAGSREVFEAFQSLVKENEGINVSLGNVGCTGRCDMEPIVTVVKTGDVPVKYVKVTPELAKEIFASHILKGEPLESHTMRQVEEWKKLQRIVSVCVSGETEDKDKTLEELVSLINKHDLSEYVYVARANYQHHEAKGVYISVFPDNVEYQDIQTENLERIVVEHLKNDKIVSDLHHERNMLTNKFMPFFGDIHFYGKQLRMTLRNCGVIDPESIDEYLAVRGYEAIAHILENYSSEKVIEIVKKSGLRGRGGGGFTTAMKWELAAKEKSEEKFIICNADEGDPGAFMDRSTIEGDPHTIIEGIMIGGYAMGATQGFIYTRAEYPLAIARLEKAITEARQKGILGKNIMGSGWDFDIEVRIGAGAFVCGEETALIKSIEGYRGEPLRRPPYPTTAGLWEKPTVINNVETYANLPVIILDSAEWFGAVGTITSKGTKVFALAGKVNRTGLIEVPMGTTLREVIYDIGGGIPNGKKFKAVQTGGPAGGCLPEEFLDTPIDYDSLKEAGSIMGSGGMIVMDEDTCMVDIARYFLEFMVEESCGQCTPCRSGTTIMLRMLEKIVNGKGRIEDLVKLEELAQVVFTASICGLGKCAPNPVLSTLKYFREEYKQHIEEKKCVAGACANLKAFKIDPEKCVGCTACKKVCPVNCINGSRKQPHEIFEEICIRCGACETACKFGAISRG